MREVRATGAVPDCPDTPGSRLQSLVHLHVTPRGRLHSRLVEPDTAGIWRTPSGNQQMRSFQGKFNSIARAEEPDPLAGLAFTAGDYRVRHDADALARA